MIAEWTIQQNVCLTPSVLFDSSKEMTVVLGDHDISPRKNLDRYNVVRKFIPKTFKDVKTGNDIMLLKVRQHLSGCDGIFTRTTWPNEQI